jgi:hypothetical protein
MSTRPVGRLASRACGMAPRSLAHSVSTKFANGARGRREISIYKSVRSDQISGNSTTSSILRR